MKRIAIHARRAFKALLTVCLALCLCAGACAEGNWLTRIEQDSFTVTYLDADGTVLNTMSLVMPEDIGLYRPDTADRGAFLHWESIKDDDGNYTARAVYDVCLQRSETRYTNQDIKREALDAFSRTPAAVIFVSFADGYRCDREKFEDMFIGEYDVANCMMSVSSYYRVNTYGRDLLDFTFFYYDCPMTCEEAWHYVNDEDESGHFRGNDFLYEVYDAVKKEHLDEINALDPDGDGTIPVAYFVTGEKRIEIDGQKYSIYGGAAGTADLWYHPAKKGDPVFWRYIKLPYENMRLPLLPGITEGRYTRTLLHETGHLFGISDYYDFYEYEDTILDTLGSFDMHSHEMGDLNPYSRFVCGWLTPYVITEDIDTVTLTLRSSSLYNEVLLIPTSKGWNGTAFDEYILIDVMAPVAANGFDWRALLINENDYEDEKRDTMKGGVRVYHVDSRLMSMDYDPKTRTSSWVRVEDIDSAIKNIGTTRSQLFAPIFYNSNGLDPYLEGESRFCHMIDIVPSDGTSKFRLSTPTYRSAYTDFRPNDLYAPGDVFSMEACFDAFPLAPYMNNGGTLDYEVRVDSYDPATTEAVITVMRIVP